MAKKEQKPLKGPRKVIRIVKNTFFSVALVMLVLTLAVTIIARVKGETPSLFGHAVYRISSGSMIPELQVGDVILSRECDPMSLKEGDIITYDGVSGEFAGKRVTHRVVKAPYQDIMDGQYYLVTKGDDNPVEDTPIAVSQVKGIMVGKLGLLTALYDFFVTPWGLLVLIGLILLAFFNEIVNFVKALFGIGTEEEKHEDIQDVIERIRREDAEMVAGQETDRSDHNQIQ